MKKFFIHLWQFPQNLLGVFALNYYRPIRTYQLEDGTEIYYTTKINGGLTLGRHVFVAASHYRHDVNVSLLRDTVRHNAIGHAKQSRILGWLYLPVLGISRLIGKMLGKGKYEFGMERWADKIANVTRKR